MAGSTSQTASPKRHRPGAPPRSRSVRFNDLPSPLDTHSGVPPNSRCGILPSRIPQPTRSLSPAPQSFRSPSSSDDETTHPSPLKSHPPDVSHHYPAPRYPAPTRPLPPTPESLEAGPSKAILKQSKQEFQGCTLPGLPRDAAERAPSSMAEALIRQANTRRASTSTPNTILEAFGIPSIKDKDGNIHYWVGVEAISANCPGHGVLPLGHWDKLVQMAKEVHVCQCTAACDCTERIRGTYSADESLQWEGREWVKEEM
ncbi:Fc.00g098640.m01.CDS01 [Cosmosporella sp. VM-42]